MQKEFFVEWLVKIIIYSQGALGIVEGAQIATSIIVGSSHILYKRKKIILYLISDV